MLEYSGTCCTACGDGPQRCDRQLEGGHCDPSFGAAWNGWGPWGHAVAPSTPSQDFRLHVKAWQHHFAAIFGSKPLEPGPRISPSEMALPNHPDVSYEYVKTFKDCGFQWVLVQEHSVEQPRTARFAAAHSAQAGGRTLWATQSITAIIKTQGSDTKLVGADAALLRGQGLVSCGPRGEATSHRS